jgi:hypothetical protein
MTDLSLKSTVIDGIVHIKIPGDETGYFALGVNLTPNTGNQSISFVTNLSHLENSGNPEQVMQFVAEIVLAPTIAVLADMFKFKPADLVQLAFNHLPQVSKAQQAQFTPDGSLIKEDAPESPTNGVENDQQPAK